ncbi:MAG: AraC family transcriptional regulator [bacterium]|nr:AraC family transcriptional regulator [bacterium]
MAKNIKSGKKLKYNITIFNDIMNIKMNVGGDRLEITKNTHTPDMLELYKRFEVYPYKNLFSIVVLKKSPDINMKSFTHTHDDYEFILPITPIPGLTNEDAIYFGEPGYAYPVSSGRRHGLKYELNDVSHHDICINKDLFEKYVKEYSGKVVDFNSEFPASIILYDYIDKYKRLALQDYQGKDIEMNAIITLICFELIKGGLNVPEGRTESLSEKDEWTQISDYLTANCVEPSIIEETCDRYGMSHTSFTKKFSKIFKVPPYQYVLRARISKAKMLMEFSDETITSIAKKCGFASLSRFSTVFKQRCGITADEYLKQKRKMR